MGKITEPRSGGTAMTQTLLRGGTTISRTPARHDVCCAVPTGLGLLFHAYPALKRWAKIFRAFGARVVTMARGLPT
jgi:hypothetical protein